MSSSRKAKLIIVLHAHLPYVRIPDKRFPLPELWLYQAITESYIPLILNFKELIKNNINFKITLSLSPTLLSMLGDKYYCAKYKDYLSTLLNLLGNEDIGDYESRPARNNLRERIQTINNFYDDTNGDIINEFRKLSAGDRINIITTSATHALLPMYRFSKSLVKSQIEAGLHTFKKAMGYYPEGFWLPEMAYFANLDEIMNNCGIRYTFLDAHSIYLTRESASYGNFFPSVTHNKIIIFPRELVLSNSIWSASKGYPGDPRYREFHYDYTYSLPDSLLAENDLEKIPFGLKIYSITGGSGPKRYYDVSKAKTAVEEHAADFIEKIKNRAGVIAGHIDEIPVFTLPFDAELFGHWWYEGPEFLKLVVEKISGSEELELINPVDMYNHSLETIIPAESSWGREGFFKSWINPECSWIYPEIAGLYNRLMNVSKNPPGRIQLQALKEIFLASSSDWTFLISNNSSKEYAEMRLKDHISSASRIVESLESGCLDEEFVDKRRELYPLFNEILDKC